jgi:hypothetical protein
MQRKVKRWKAGSFGWSAILLGLMDRGIGRAASNNIVALHRALAEEAEIRKLMAWDRRWYNVRLFPLVAGIPILGIDSFAVQQAVRGYSQMRALSDLLARLKGLTKEEYETMTHLQETHDAVRDSPDSLLPLGSPIRVVGVVLRSTLTSAVTTFAET